MRTSSMPPPMPWCSSSARPSSTRLRRPHATCWSASPTWHDGWDRLGMVHEARGDSRQAADCYRKVIDFISQHPDDYDAGMVEQFAKLVEKTRSASRDLSAPPSIGLGEGVCHPTISDRDQIARPPPSNTVIGLTLLAMW